MLHMAGTVLGIVLLIVILILLFMFRKVIKKSAELCEKKLDEWKDED